MSNSHHKTIVSCWICVLVALLHTISHVRVDGRQVFDDSNIRPKQGGVVRSIEVPEDGDVIDCVLVHTQPGFDNSQIRNLQVLSELKNDKKYPQMYQNWHKHGECPNGSVPIRRVRNDDVHTKVSYGEFANVEVPNGTYKGADASISLWNPKVEAGEYSLAHVSIQAGVAYFGTLTALEAGWIVYPKRYHDSQSRLFTHWTTNNFGGAGCFDLDCPGFVQLDPKFAIGVPITPTSASNGSTFESTFSIYKSRETGNWKFEFQGVLLGYWPASIVPLLGDHAETVRWAGEVLNNVNKNHHTTTQMGNGEFSKEVNSKEVNRKAAYIRDLHVFNKDYISEPATNLPISHSDPECYDVTIGNVGTIYYGGYGYSQRCNYTLTP